MKKKVLEMWPEWLIHKARGRPSNHKLDDSKYKEALEIIKTKCHDYWPTLACEKLAERHAIFVSLPTLRNQMIKQGIWKVKKRKKPVKQFKARERRECYWEMQQYDGSYHKWFEGRDGTDEQCLLVAVDDATGKVTAKFELNEWLESTFRFWKEYIMQIGKPKSIYLDKFATYKVNHKHATDDRELRTQFGRACKELWIELIFANSPQGKWRVERMNGTLQDRLIKGLREEWISDIPTANKYLQDVFLPDYNRKFMVQPRSEADLHIALQPTEQEKLPQIFSEHTERKIANDFTIRINNKYYQLYRKKEGNYMIRAGDTVTVEQHLDGSLKISKNWVYVEHSVSFDRPLKQCKLYTAPVIESDDKKEKQEEKTYFQKHWKPHPFVTNCFSQNKVTVP